MLCVEDSLGAEPTRREGAHGERGPRCPPHLDLCPSTLYAEFLESVAAIYQDLLSGKNPNTVIVPTLSRGSTASGLLWASRHAEGVEAHCSTSAWRTCDRTVQVRARPAPRGCRRRRPARPPPPTALQALLTAGSLTVIVLNMNQHHLPPVQAHD